MGEVVCLAVAIAHVESEGLLAKNNGPALAIYSEEINIKDIVVLKHCHLVRRVSGVWCVYGDHPEPVGELSTFEAAVDFAVMSVKAIRKNV